MFRLNPLTGHALIKDAVSHYTFQFTVLSFLFLSAKQPAPKSTEDQEEEEEVVEESEEEITVGSEEGDENVSQEHLVAESAEEVVGFDEEIQVQSEEETDVGAEGTETEARSLIFQ